MKIDSIQSGIVLDHIKAGKSMQIYKYLGLDDLDCSVAIIKNASSSKMGKKDIIKIADNMDLNLDEFLELDKQRREITGQVEVLKSQRNADSQEIGKMKKAGENAFRKNLINHTSKSWLHSSKMNINGHTSSLSDIRFFIYSIPVPSKK